ncbi:4Fe-4S binding protein [Planctomycetota bacterium]
MKLRPVEFATDGVFVCGLAHGPKSIDESIAQAKAAASRASTVLVKDSLMTEDIVCSVNEDVCGGCGICELMCPYGAIAVDRAKNIAVANEALCKGCGTCASGCPSGAAQQRGFKRNQVSDGLLSMVEMAFRAYDPCLACATHAFPGQRPLDVVLRDPRGNVVDAFSLAGRGKRYQWREGK